MKTIVKKGRDVNEIIYKIACEQCGTIFTYDRSDLSSEQPHTVSCPVTECQHSTWHTNSMRVN